VKLYVAKFTEIIGPQTELRTITGATYIFVWAEETVDHLQIATWPCHGSGGQSPASHRGGSRSIPGQSM
jgi:hypothetical protein